MRAARTRWARGNVPQSVPDVDAPLVSLLDDPPGRALVASYVPRPSTDIDGEAVEFYGVDRRWRRLSLVDLDLPADVWHGGDTYGAGALSPNGRWWAGPMVGGMFLVDLRDGSVKVLRVSGGTPGLASFGWSPDSDELVLILKGRSSRVSVPSLKLHPFPRPRAYPRLRANGDWWECPSRQRTVTECHTYRRDGTLLETRSTPEHLRTPWAAPTGEAGEAHFFSVPQGPYGNRRHDWEVLRTDAGFRADARLVLPAESEINGVGDAFGPAALGLAAIESRLLLAWLVDDQQIVRLIRPGLGRDPGGMDWWDVSFANDLVSIH